MLIERDIEKEIRKWINSKEIIAVVGPRQSGKTTLLLRIKEILSQEHDLSKIHYVSFEDDFEKEKFEKNFKDYLDYYVAGDKASKHFFLFDEVQYIKNAGKMLKMIYDSFSNIKLIITGSSSLDVRGVGGALVGRVIFFELYPFSFEEFLKAKDQKIHSYYNANKFYLSSEKIKEILFLDKLNKLLTEYLTYGGYPSVVLEEDIEKKKVLLKNLFLTYVEKDIVKIYGDKYRGSIHGLVRHLASIVGSIINYNDICSINNVYYKELKEILNILEDTYVIRSIKPFHRNLVTELKKNPKIYFVDSGLRNFIIDKFSFSEQELGFLLENYVCNLFRGRSLNYWRTTAKAEVDFVFQHRGDVLIPIEAKSRAKITRSFLSFFNSYSPKKGFLINFNGFYQKDLGKGTVFVVPACIFTI